MRIELSTLLKNWVSVPASLSLLLLLSVGWMFLSRRLDGSDRALWRLVPLLIVGGVLCIAAPGYLIPKRPYEGRSIIVLGPHDAITVLDLFGVTLATAGVLLGVALVCWHAFLTPATFTHLPRKPIVAGAVVVLLGVPLTGLTAGRFVGEPLATPFDHVPGPGLITVQDTDTNGAIRYTGSWETVSESDAFGGTVAWSTTSGDSATVTFTGTDIAWITATGPNMGHASIRLDGVEVRPRVNLYSPTPAVRVIGYSRSGLDNSAHTLTIEVLPTKNLRSTGTAVQVDAFVVGR